MQVRESGGDSPPVGDYGGCRGCCLSASVTLSQAPGADIAGAAELLPRPILPLKPFGLRERFDRSCAFLGDYVRSLGDRIYENTRQFNLARTSS